MGIDDFLIQLVKYCILDTSFQIILLELITDWNCRCPCRCPWIISGETQGEVGRWRWKLRGNFRRIIFGLKCLFFAMEDTFTKSQKNTKSNQKIRICIEYMLRMKK